MFSEKTFTFLAELEQNNQRDWFNQHKARYEDTVREPALAFIRQMQAPISAISSHLLPPIKKWVAV